MKQDTGISKVTGDANTDDSSWGHYGCGWKVAGSWCDCYNDNRMTRKVVWRMPSRDASRKGAVHGGHPESVNPDHVQVDPDQDQDQHQNPDQADQDHHKN